MKIYIDLIIIINFFFDFILLFCVSIILKRNVKIKRIVLASLIGGISIISLFIPFNTISLFLFKLFISIIMILIAFSYKNFKYTFDNFIYLYVISIFLGGFLYFLNTSFSYKNVGLIFFHNGLSINIIFIIIASPIILILYIKNNKKLKEEYSKKYKVSITLLNDKKLNLTAFLDTGNNMYDPYKNRPIILINKAVLNDYNPPVILVPCKTINKSSLIPCFKIKELVVNDKIIKDKYLVGISDNNFDCLGVELLLHNKLTKEI